MALTFSHIVKRAIVNCIFNVFIKIILNIPSLYFSFEAQIDNNGFAHPDTWPQEPTLRLWVFYMSMSDSM